MLSYSIVASALICAAVVCAQSRPPLSSLSPLRPAPLRPYDDQSVPTPYDFNYKVDNPPTNTFFGQNEAGDLNGRVAGSYYVYLPDGRLMTVEYTVDGESGFVPRISFQNQGGPSNVVRG